MNIEKLVLIPVAAVLIQGAEVWLIPVIPGISGSIREDF